MDIQQILLLVFGGVFLWKAPQVMNFIKLLLVDKNIVNRNEKIQSGEAKLEVLDQKIEEAKVPVKVGKYTEDETKSFWDEKLK